LNGSLGGQMDPDEYISATRFRHGCEWPEGKPNFQSSSVDRLASHWSLLAAKADGGVPYRHEIDPALFGGALSRVYVYERGDTEFICRLAGERISWNYDARLKGRSLSEILDPSVHDMANLFMMTCVEVPAVYHNLGLLYGDAEKREVAGERVFLPLRGDDGRVVFLIGATDVDAVHGTPDCPNRAFYPCEEFSEPHERAGKPSRVGVSPTPVPK
jgi:hypothetical protein